ncbi:hypothetical protein [Nocardia sp. NPDC058666]|uniref:hypothetical protein n=1 Tax=Actinomycetes TaxID=1760 RepID=UPI00366232CB
MGWKFFANCVIPEKKTPRKSRAFVIVIVLAVLATVGLSVAGMPPVVSIQLMAAVLGGIEAVRRLTGSREAPMIHPPAPGTPA